MTATVEETAHDLISGQVVAGRYEIDRPIGEGGMGVVYLAYDRSLGSERRVALKILARRHVGRAAREKRFSNEARFAGRLPMHTNLATTLDAGRIEDGRPYIAMEYVDGPAINGLRVVTGRAIPPAEVCRMALGVAEALRAIHQAGLVHRDITPINVLVTTIGGEWVPKVIDFSHAAAVDGPRLELGHPSRLTQPHEIPGTPGYMPPEQVGNVYPSPSMDVFAFGVVLWELLAERHAYRQRDRADYFDKQQQAPQAPPPLVEHRAGLPPALYQLVEDCTHLDPAKRPQAHEIVSRLEAIVWGMTQPEGPSEIRRSTTGVVVAPSEPSKVSVAPHPSMWVEPDAEPDERPRRTLTIAVALAVMIAVGAIAWVWLQRQDPRGAAPEEQLEEVNGAASAEQPAVVPPSEDPAPVEVTTAVAEVEEPRAPAPDQPSVDEPDEDGTPEADAPEPISPPKARSPSRSAAAVRDSNECVTLRATADVAFERLDWSELLRLTDQSRCWSAKTRSRMRARALLELGRYQACVREHGRSRDPAVIDIVKGCKESLSP